MVNTFLPFPDFAASASVLDKRRAIKQVVEAKQILDGSWARHPASIMWRGHETLLKKYYNAVFDACVTLHSANFTAMTRFTDVDDIDIATLEKPWWLGCEQYHKSHQASLLRKDPDHYGPLFPDLEEVYRTRGYVWPSHCSATNVTFAAITTAAVCAGIKKDGNKCTNKASVGNYCKIHAKS